MILRVVMSEESTTQDLEQKKPVDTRQAVSAALFSLMEIQRPAVADHCKRVARWTRELGILSALSDAELDELECAALLHDIGFMASSLTLLYQAVNNRFTDENAKAHPVLGYTILSKLPGFQNIAQAVLSHHERFDGQGFPEKKRSETIPLYARIIAVADMFDLESRCSSLGAVSVEAVRRKMSGAAGKALDPELANRLLFIVTTNEELNRFDRHTAEVPFSALRPGMVLARDLCAIDGAILLKEGTELTQRMLDRAFASSNLDWLLTTAHVTTASMKG